MLKQIRCCICIQVLLFVVLSSTKYRNFIVAFHYLSQTPVIRKNKRQCYHNRFLLWQTSSSSSTPNNNNNKHQVQKTGVNNYEVNQSKQFEKSTTEIKNDNNDQKLINDFEEDVRKVLHDLRSRQSDPEIPAWFRNKGLSFTNYWGLEEWDLHTSRRRFLRYIFGFPKSRLLRRLLPQLLILLVWSCIAVLLKSRHWVHNVIPTIAKNRGVHVPLTSLSLVSTFVAALQTIRSNQGLSRLAEARISQGKMVLYTRDTALLISAYLKDDIKSRIQIARLLSLFGWLHKSHVRGTEMKNNSKNDDYKLITTMIPDPSQQQYILNARKRPIALIVLIREILYNAAVNGWIQTTEHRLMENNIRILDEVVTTGERIRATPVPPVYAAHSTRLMIFYLTFLPFALMGTSSSLNGLSTISITMTIGFAMLGLDELSSLFELPYRFMPMHQLSKVSMMDVADAFCYIPPPVTATTTSQQLQQQHRPRYWVTTNTTLSSLPFDGRDVPMI